MRGVGDARQAALDGAVLAAFAVSALGADVGEHQRAFQLARDRLGQLGLARPLDAVEEEVQRLSGGGVLQLLVEHLDLRIPLREPGVGDGGAVVDPEEDRIEVVARRAAEEGAEQRGELELVVQNAHPPDRPVAAQNPVQVVPREDGGIAAAENAFVVPRPRRGADLHERGADLLPQEDPGEGDQLGLGVVESVGLLDDRKPAEERIVGAALRVFENREQFGAHGIVEDLFLLVPEDLVVAHVMAHELLDLVAVALSEQALHVADGVEPPCVFGSVVGAELERLRLSGGLEEAELQFRAFLFVFVPVDFERELAAADFDQGLALSGPGGRRRGTGGRRRGELRLAPLALRVELPPLVQTDFFEMLPDAREDFQRVFARQDGDRVVQVGTAFVRPLRLDVPVPVLVALQRHEVELREFVAVARTALEPPDDLREIGLRRRISVLFHSVLLLPFRSFHTPKIARIQ